MPLDEVSKQGLDPATWNAVVDTAPAAWLFHRFEFQETLATWPVYEDLSFALVDSKGGQVHALVPCHRRASDALESLGGPVTAQVLGPNQSRAALEQAHAALRQKAATLNLPRVQVRLLAMAERYRGEACPRVNPLLAYGYRNTLSQTYVVDLRRDEAKIWDRLAPDCRTHVRKAEKEGCTVRLASASKEDLEIYYELHRETYHRTGVSPHPFAYFEAIWRHFVAEGRAIVFFAERAGQVIAADNEAFYKNAMSGWTAAGKEEAARVGANNLLHWHAMRWARENRAEWYESGEAFPGATEGKSKGLNAFKKSFGGELYPVYKAEMEIGLGRPTQKGLPSRLMSRIGGLVQRRRKA
jgi:Acetyltransferase (GNAT) domain